MCVFEWLIASLVLKIDTCDLSIVMFRYLWFIFCQVKFPFYFGCFLFVNFIFPPLPSHFFLPFCLNSFNLLPCSGYNWCMTHQMACSSFSLRLVLLMPRHYSDSTCLHWVLSNVKRINVFDWEFHLMLCIPQVVLLKFKNVKNIAREFFSCLPPFLVNSVFWNLVPINCEDF